MILVFGSLNIDINIYNIYLHYIYYIHHYMIKIITRLFSFIKSCQSTISPILILSCIFSLIVRTVKKCITMLH